MTHSGAGFVKQALLQHLIVGKQGAIEKDDGCPFEPCRQLLVYGSAPRYVKEGLLVEGISDFEADGVAGLAAEVGRRLVLQVEGDLAGHGKGFDRQP